MVHRKQSGDRLTKRTRRRAVRCLNEVADCRRSGAGFGAHLRRPDRRLGRGVMATARRYSVHLIPTDRGEESSPPTARGWRIEMSVPS
jgi:hypothetical protein